MRRIFLLGLVGAGMTAATLSASARPTSRAVSALAAPPLEVIEALGPGFLTGTDPSDRDTFFKRGPETFAWGGEKFLAHVVNDTAPTSTVGLGWSNYTYNQELIGFNVQWSSGLEAPDPSVDGIPSPNYTFHSLISDYDGLPDPYKAKTWTGDRLAHVVFYDHGQCRIDLPWAPLAEMVSQQARGSVWCNVQCHDVKPTVSLLFDHVQADFTSQQNDIEMGLAIEAQYHFQWGPFGDNALVQAYYRFDVNPIDGLLSIAPWPPRVFTTNQDDRLFANAMLKTLPQRIANTALVSAVSVPLGVASFTCNPHARVSAQQQGCYDLAQKPAVAGGPSPLREVLKNLLTRAGDAEDVATLHTGWAAQAVEPRNFACAEAAGGGGTCAFHPIIERVLVLPDVLEFVLANTDDQNKIQLYRAADQLIQIAATLQGGLPALYTQLVAPGPLCGGPLTRAPDGPIPMYEHDEDPVSGPPPSLTGGSPTCPPCSP